jgi:hypothetical protein
MCDKVDAWVGSCLAKSFIVERVYRTSFFVLPVTLLQSYKIINITSFASYCGALFVLHDPFNKVMHKLSGIPEKSRRMQFEKYLANTTGLVAELQNSSL